MRKPVRRTPMVYADADGLKKPYCLAFFRYATIKCEHDCSVFGSVDFDLKTEDHDPCAVAIIYHNFFNGYK